MDDYDNLAWFADMEAAAERSRQRCIAELREAGYTSAAQHLADSQ